MSHSQICFRFMLSVLKQNSLFSILQVRKSPQRGTQPQPRGPEIHADVISTQFCNSPILLYKYMFKCYSWTFVTLDDGHISIDIPSSITLDDSYISIDIPSSITLDDSHISIDIPSSITLDDRHISIDIPSSITLDDSHISIDIPSSITLDDSHISIDISETRLSVMFQSILFKTCRQIITQMLFQKC